MMAEAQASTSSVRGPLPPMPSASTFSFTAPFPPPSGSPNSLKQRRVSLALPSSPRLFPAWSFRDDTGLGTGAHAADPDPLPEKRGKMRRIENSSGDSEEPQAQLVEKKQRKKWSMEETQMLVTGCNKWGVGNWKSILNDPEFKFDGRSPVDLKDRFRTYFPDAYKQHYPNAKTHLSSKVRSSLPDGTSIFEKTRSKKRRPFTEEEDRALKAGYDKHGTVWATIAKDPIFQEQNRRSTDLRDRFRNAFPDLYQAAGYKPRAAAKKTRGREINGKEIPHPVRAATDDQIASGSGPVRRTRRHTTQGLLGRGGTKSVPESVANSEDEESSDEEDLPAQFAAQPSTSAPQQLTFAQNMDATHQMSADDDPFAEVDMQPIDALAIPDYNSSLSMSDMADSSQTWSSVDTPIHASWSAAGTVSPTSSQLGSDYFITGTRSPFPVRPGTSSSNGASNGRNVMIGKSAWGPADWLSPNPRLDPSSAFSPTAASSATASSYLPTLSLSPTPSSPFSFSSLSSLSHHLHMQHGVMDRYDLFPPSSAHDYDFSSEAGAGDYDSLSAFSDPQSDSYPPSAFRGLAHHRYAGDLIFGARTHQPVHPFDGGYGLGFGFGGAGLGLSGVQQATLHTPALPGIDEIELTSITLDDPQVPMPVDTDPPAGAPEGTGMDAPLGDPLAELGLAPQLALEDLVGLRHADLHEMHATPPATPHHGHSHGRRPQSNPPGVHLAQAQAHRSVSVPPRQRAVLFPGPLQTQAQRPALTPTRSLSLMDLIPLQPSDAEAFDAQSARTAMPPPSAYPSAGPDGWRSPGEYDLPFLDLHYKSSGGDAGGSMASAAEARQGLALDLAQTAAPARGPFPGDLGAGPFAQHVDPRVLARGAGGSGQRMTMHQRGQSAVSPQDLQLRKTDGNKRKRSSWDAGMF